MYKRSTFFHLVYLSLLACTLLLLGDSRPTWAMCVANPGPSLTFEQILRGMASNTPAIRQQAVAQLGEYGPSAQNSRLALTALADPDAGVRAAAVQSLASLEDSPEALPALEPALEPALADPDAGVRVAAVQSLASLGAAPALKQLRHLLHDDSPVVRAAAVEALACSYDHHVRALLASALHDNAPGVREAAVKVFGLTDDYALLSLALHDKAASVREAVVDALAPKNKKRPAYTLLLRALGDNAASVRSAATEALKGCHRPKVIRALVKAAGDASPEVRASALTVLLSLHAKNMRPILLAHQADRDADVRACIAEGLGAYPRDAAVRRALLTLLQDHDGAVQLNAAMASGKVKARVAVSALIKHLHKNEDLDVAIATALGQIGDARALPALKELARSHKSQLCCCTLNALAKLDSQGAFPLLGAALHDTDNNVRLEAAALLVRSGVPAADHWILALLNERGQDFCQGERSLDFCQALLNIVAQRKLVQAIPVLLTLYRRNEPMFDHPLGEDALTARYEQMSLDTLVALGKPAVPALLSLLNGGGKALSNMRNIGPGGHERST